MLHDLCATFCYKHKRPTPPLVRPQRVMSIGLPWPGSVVWVGGGLCSSATLSFPVPVVAGRRPGLPAPRRRAGGVDPGGAAVPGGAGLHGGARPHLPHPHRRPVAHGRRPRQPGACLRVPRAGCAPPPGHPLSWQCMPGTSPPPGKLRYSRTVGVLVSINLSGSKFIPLRHFSHLEIIRDTTVPADLMVLEAIRVSCSIPGGRGSAMQCG